MAAAKPRHSEPAWSSVPGLCHGFDKTLHLIGAAEAVVAYWSDGLLQEHKVETREALFERLGVRSITEALTFANNQGLL